MLKNLHNLFVSEMEYIHKGKNTEIIDERTLLRLHSGLSSGLVSDEEAGLFRRMYMYSLQSFRNNSTIQLPDSGYRKKSSPIILKAEIEVSALLFATDCL